MDRMTCTTHSKLSTQRCFRVANAFKTFYLFCNSYVMNRSCYLNHYRRHPRISTREMRNRAAWYFDGLDK